MGLNHIMKQDNLVKFRRSVAISYVFMFFALFTVVSGALAYWYARKVIVVDSTEVWLQAQALWIMRNVLIYSVLALFAAYQLYSSPYLTVKPLFLLWLQKKFWLHAVK